MITEELSHPAEATQATPTDASKPSKETAANNLQSATRPFAQEHRAWSWWSLWSTLAVLGCLLAWSAMAPWFWLRVVAAVFAGLVMVRGFILYHDFLHGAILKKSKLAKMVLSAYGCMLLTPPRSWKKSHNFHHAHVGLPEHSHVGSFQILTVEQWQQAGTAKRIGYRLLRSPLVLGCAYATVFMWSICLQPLFRDPKRHWDSFVAMIIHLGAASALYYLGGWTLLVTTLLVPQIIAAATGALLFYLQHNYPSMKMLKNDEWTRESAAIASSSFLKLGPIGRWLTGNIGFHHVHHANHKIPFYRLPEAMRAVPDLQAVTALRLRFSDVWTSLRLALWDEKQGRLVTIGSLRKS